MTLKSKRILTVLFVVILSAVTLHAMSQKTVRHTVDIGETLASIAEKYGMDEARIIELNPDASDFIYVGMVLEIPVAPEALAEKTEPSPFRDSSQSTVVSFPENNGGGTDNRQEEKHERKSAVFEIGYTAGSFEAAKLSGMYGISFTLLPWEMAPDLYLGMHLSPVNFNFGLVPKGLGSYVFMLGPALGYYFTPNIFISAPLDIACGIMSGPDDKYYTSWGMYFSPSIYVGGKWGVFVGPALSVPFVDNAKVTCGFRAGIYF